MGIVQLRLTWMALHYRLIAAANAWLPGFITAYNTRFGRGPANAKSLPLA